ncbi:hypothetical protein MRX96_030394 [Rhipicephalus microplus]
MCLCLKVCLFIGQVPSNNLRSSGEHLDTKQVDLRGTHGPQTSEKSELKWLTSCTERHLGVAAPTPPASWEPHRQLCSFLLEKWSRMTFLRHYHQQQALQVSRRLRTWTSLHLRQPKPGPQHNDKAPQNIRENDDREQLAHHSHLKAEKTASERKETGAQESRRRDKGNSTEKPMKKGGQAPATFKGRFQYCNEASPGFTSTLNPYHEDGSGSHRSLPTH